MRELLFMLLVVACPLAMFLMMRGGHGHGHGHGHGPSVHGGDEPGLSAEELRRRRGELDRLIGERERAETAVSDEATRLRPVDDPGKTAGATSTR